MREQVTAEDVQRRTFKPIQRRFQDLETGQLVKGGVFACYTVKRAGPAQAASACSLESCFDLICIEPNDLVVAEACKHSRERVWIEACKPGGV